MGNQCCDCFKPVYLSEYAAIDDDVQSLLSPVIRDSNYKQLSEGEDDEASEASNEQVDLPSPFDKFYEIGKVLGVGTTSRVFEIARSAGGFGGVNIPLACKVIDKPGVAYGLGNDDVDLLMEQLCKEVDILRRLRHPNIVQFFDYFETRQNIFIITERLYGGELFDFILQNGPLSENFACQILYGVFSAVAYLHDRGVIHRDIKAENLIFFQTPSGEPSLKLIDFGFSTVLRHDLTGSFMGTGGYIAPEIRQSKIYSTSVDSWSLGVLLYCTLSARLPFGVSIESLPTNKEECRDAFQLTFASARWVHVSDECKHLIARLLELDPIKRMTAQEALQHRWFRVQSKQQETPIRRSADQPILNTKRNNWQSQQYYQARNLNGADQDGEEVSRFPAFDHVIEFPTLRSKLRLSMSLGNFHSNRTSPLFTGLMSARSGGNSSGRNSLKRRSQGRRLADLEAEEQDDDDAQPLTSVPTDSSSSSFRRQESKPNGNNRSIKVRRKTHDHNCKHSRSKKSNSRVQPTEDAGLAEMSTDEDRGINSALLTNQPLARYLRTSFSESDGEHSTADDHRSYVRQRPSRQGGRRQRRPWHDSSSSSSEEPESLSEGSGYCSDSGEESGESSMPADGNGGANVAVSDAKFPFQRQEQPDLKSNRSTSVGNLKRLEPQFPPHITPSQVGYSAYAGDLFYHSNFNKPVRKEDSDTNAQ